MVADHLLTTKDKSTAEFIDLLGPNEVPVARLRRKLGKYKVRKALTEVKELAAAFSRVLKARFSEAVGEVDAAFNGLDAELTGELKGFADQIDFEIVELFKKEHEGKSVDHVRLHPGVKVERRGTATVIKVKK